MSLEDELVIPIVKEHAVVTKVVTETGRVRLVTHVQEQQASINEVVRHDDVSVERVAIGRVVDVAPIVRREGDTLIYPVVEETLVIEKRLLLKEEVRVTYRSRLEIIDQQVTLRAVHADVQRFPTTKS